MLSRGWHGNIGAETGQRRNLAQEQLIKEARAVNNRPSFIDQVSAEQSADYIPRRSLRLEPAPGKRIESGIPHGEQLLF
jgi:hypothetical protein